METIKSLIAEKFCLFNVDCEKRPCNKYEALLSKWETKTCAELELLHNMESSRWGMRMGLQENGRYIMSLDFDCCGQEDKSTKKRKGCEYTKNKLKEYLEITDTENGIYNSSTEGNMNVLVDYSNLQKIREYVQQIGSKFKLEGMEVLLGNKHQQVIPPSTTKCKINGKVFIQRKFHNNEPFNVVTEGSVVYPFILGLFEEHLHKNPNKISKLNVDEITNAVVYNTEVNVETTEDKYLELVNNVIRNDVVNGKEQIDWDDWFHIAGILKTNGYSITNFINYSIKNEGTTEHAAKKLWNGISSEKKLSIYGLQNIAKKINPTEYKKWLINHGKYITLETLEKGENDIAKHISIQLINHLVFCNNKWFAFDKINKHWRVVNQPCASIISHIQNKIDEAKEIMLILKQRLDDETEKKKYVEYEKKYNDYYKQVGKGAFTSQIAKILQDYLFDGEFENKLDTTPYQIAYKNGIMDLKTGEFREGLKPQDYITRTIPYNFEKALESDIIEVRKELLKICNMKEEHLEYYLSVFGYSLTGDASKIQEFYCIRGQTASNGKSVIFEALHHIIPNYIVKMESQFWEVNYGSRHKEIASWKGIRIAWLNEMSKKKQDENALKEVADGCSMRYKVMFGGMDTMPITFKQFIVSNNTLNINADNGIKRRMKIQQLDSDFLEDLEEDDYVNRKFKKDMSFGSKLITKYKFALMELLFKYSKKFVDDGFKLKPYPVDWKQESDEVVKDNNKFQEFFDDRFEVVVGAETSKADVEGVLAMFPDRKVDLKMFKDALKAMRISYTYDSQKREGGKKGWWSGFKKRSVENADQEC